MGTTDAILDSRTEKPRLSSALRAHLRGRLACIIDMMGGKPSCHVLKEDVCPTFTRGRGAVSDVHSICIVSDFN